MYSVRCLGRRFGLGKSNKIRTWRHFWTGELCDFIAAVDPAVDMLADTALKSSNSMLRLSTGSITLAAACDEAAASGKVAIAALLLCTAELARVIKFVLGRTATRLTAPPIAINTNAARDAYTVDSLARPDTLHAGMRPSAFPTCIRVCTRCSVTLKQTKFATYFSVVITYLAGTSRPNRRSWTPR